MILGISLALLAGSFSSCSKVPVTGRKQLNVVPDNMMLSLSFTSYKEFLGQNPPLPSSDPQSAMVKRVGHQLAIGVQDYMKSKGLSKQLKGYQWEFNLVRDEAINAWCMPGGKIVVYTGILPVTKDEGGLAVVMGHEVAHAIARHGNERLSQQLAVALGAVSLDVAMKEKPQQTKELFMSLYGVGATLGTLAYSRQHEYEADKMGLVFMAMAGYDPERAVSFWEAMATKSGPKPPEFLSTHPGDDNRIKALREFMPEAKKYYKPR